MEGLRAVAVALVVLYHAAVPGVHAGFIGVDVFFVVSGFVITRLLARELRDTGRLSLVQFYARRSRRILPAATLVTVVAVAATYLVLGAFAGPLAADDGRWTALFAANLHFARLGTSYFAAQQEPSPLQHMWSLGVEEQFYLLWPVLLLVLSLRTRSWAGAVRRICPVLVLVVVASYTWSVLETSQNGAWAFFSPLTRAGELGLGALVALVTPVLPAVPAAVCDLAGLGGLTAVLFSAWFFTAGTPWPGSAVLLPTAATALVLLAGGARDQGATRTVLGGRPLQWLGSRSFSLYLWHWPVLIIAAERAGAQRLPLATSLLLVAAATVLAEVSYRVLENPVRSSRWLRRRPGLSVAAGVTLAAGTFAAMTFLVHHQ